MRRAAKLATFANYIDGNMDPEELAANYTQLPKTHWGTFSGPCYVPKSSKLDLNSKSSTEQR